MSLQEPFFVATFSARFTWPDASRGLQRTTWVLEGVDAARSKPAARTAAPISTTTTNDVRDGIGLNVGAPPRPGYRDEHVRSGDIPGRWPSRRFVRYSFRRPPPGRRQSPGVKAKVTTTRATANTTSK